MFANLTQPSLVSSVQRTAKYTEQPAYIFSDPVIVQNECQQKARLNVGQVNQACRSGRHEAIPEGGRSEARPYTSNKPQAQSKLKRSSRLRVSVPRPGRLTRELNNLEFGEGSAAP